MNANDNIGRNRAYKDTLFRWLFSESKENALSLYNAINGSNYTDVNDLEFRTLNDVIYMKFKNDVSFLVDDKFLCFIEHQSSFNPNMPLRGFFYAADSYRQLLGDSENIYGSKLIKIPVPQYIVLYNGPALGMKTDVAYLRLLDAIEIGKAEILNQQKTELIDLVHAGELSISVAAKLLHISEEEFSKLLK